MFDFFFNIMDNKSIKNTLEEMMEKTKEEMNNVHV